MAKLRTLLVAANWKMNPPPVGSYTQDSPYRTTSRVDVWVFPSFLDLHSAQAHGLITGAQCGRPLPEGAFTGDVSIKMLADQHVKGVLCGHSERRQHHKETDALIAEQVIAAMEAGLHPIVCIGETLDEREAGKQKSVVDRQLKAIPFAAETSAEMLIAYEPVWAIGTGKTATAPQAQEMHAFIRSLLPKDVQAKTRILYGGSAKAETAYELLHQNDIDGLLVGGASLKPKEFQAIVEAALEVAA